MSGAAAGDFSTPVGVRGSGSGAGVIAIAAGGNHSLTLKSDGSVLAWGLNSGGQLGTGDAIPVSTLPEGEPSPEGICGYVQEGRNAHAEQKNPPD